MLFKRLVKLDTQLVKLFSTEYRFVSSLNNRLIFANKLPNANSQIKRFNSENAQKAQEPKRFERPTGKSSFIVSMLIRTSNFN
jgi:hypothetical protein